jgi:hypothetical protein
MNGVNDAALSSIVAHVDDVVHFVGAGEQPAYAVGQQKWRVAWCNPPSTGLPSSRSKALLA